MLGPHKEIYITQQVFGSNSMEKLLWKEEFASMEDKDITS